MHQFYSSHRCRHTNFLQCVPVDSPTHEFPLGNFRDLSQLFIRRNRISFSLVFNCFEIQQTQVFALFPMLVGFLANIDRRPIRDDMRPLQQAARVEFTRVPGRPEALRLRVVLIRVQQHEEILRKYPAAVVFVRELVNGRLGIVDVDAFRLHPLIALG